MPRSRTLLVAAAGALVLAACSEGPQLTGPSSPASPSFDQSPATPPGLVRHEFAAHGNAPSNGLYVGTASAGRIFYHGGALVPAQKVVAIYWAAQGRQPVYNGGPTSAGGRTGPGTADGSLVGHFLRSVGGSPYYAINTTYKTSATTIANSLTYSGYWVADNSWGDGSFYVPSGTQNVSDAQMQTLLTYGFNNGYLTYDANTLYLVFTADQVNLGGGFHTQYCAYHGNLTINGKVTLYAAMPDDYAYPGSCAAQTTTPNGDSHADTEVSVLVHEIEETNTDPRLNAWYDNRGYENADKCAWTWGAYSTLPSGAAYNVTLGGKKFLIQQNWINKGSTPGRCGMHL